jgi:predicted transcriptional regulator
MAKDTNQTIEKKLDAVIELLQHLLALELSKNGVTQEVIGKRLHVAKATVVEMLKGIKKEK